MKKNIFLRTLLGGAVLVCALLFTSCIDVVQSVTLKNGAFHVSLQVTLSKDLLALVGEDGADFINEIDADDMPAQLSVKQINTDTEIGIFCSGIIDPLTQDTSLQEMIPLIEGTTVTLALPLGEGLSDGMSNASLSNEMAQSVANALFSSAKYRILVGKSLAPHITRAFLSDGTLRPQTVEVNFYDLSDMYCIELPLSVFLQDVPYDRLVLQTR